MARGPRWLALTWVCCSFGCATAPSPSDSADVLDPQSMYPLRTGNAWSYDVDTGEASTMLAVTRVEAREGDEVQVRTGSQIVRYELAPEGIRKLPEGTWLFRAPFVVGAQWPAPGGRAARLVATDSAVETPAGSFSGCLEVLETGGQLELEVRTVYCPDVGPVSVESTMRSNVSERSLTVRATLRGYEVNPR